MRSLQFIVDGQRIRKDPKCDFSNIVAGSVGYLKAIFCFSTEWDGCKKAASFWLDDREYSVLLDNDNACIIPKETLTDERFYVSVTGAKPGYKIKTSRTKVIQEVY